MRRPLTGLAALPLLLATSSTADIGFHADLDGLQETDPVVTEASGSAVLTLNDAMDRLEIVLTIEGIDLDGNQTEDLFDDLFSAHIHAAAAGVNGVIVFGFQNPQNDENGDLVIDATAGTITSAWDLDEGDGTTLTEQLPALFAEGLYFNVHTPRNIAGEIRGQIIPDDPDGDADGVPDSEDNCSDAANGPVAGPNDQLDVDADGHGNVCDGDFNQDEFVGGPDFNIFLACFNQEVDEAVGPPEDPNCAESDMNADGFVGGPDFELFLQVFNGPPGPSQGACGLGFELAFLGVLAARWRRRGVGRH